ncbi:hypothetical protein ACHWQZ_G007699 [Mnemiopsis leidyi]
MNKPFPIRQQRPAENKGQRMKPKNSPQKNMYQTLSADKPDTLFISSSMFRNLNENMMSSSKHTAKVLFYPGANSYEMLQRLLKDEEFYTLDKSAIKQIFVLTGSNYIESLASDSPELWKEHFRLEVLHVEKLQKRRQIMQACDKPAHAAPDEFMNFKTAKIVFRNALSSIDLTSDNLSGFTEIVQKLEFNQDDLMKFLYESALKQSPATPFLWIKLAEFVMTKDVIKAQSILQTAFATVQTFECLMSIIEFMIKFSEKLGNILSAMTDYMGRSLDTLSLINPDKVIKIGDLMIKNDLSSFLEKIIDIALRKCPESQSLWLYKVHNLSHDPIKDLEEALLVLPKDSKILLEYLSSLALLDQAKCRSNWEKIIKESYSAPLISHYVQYVYASFGLADARKVFKAVQNWHTIPEETVTELLKYEIANKTDSEQVCQLFNFLTNNFDKAENWKFYWDYCRKNSPEQISSVLWKCRKSMSEAQIAQMF